MTYYNFSQQQIFRFISDFLTPKKSWFKKQKCSILILPFTVYDSKHLTF